MIEGYILEILLILVIFGISTILFSKAAGTLNPGKVNVISYIYYKSQGKNTKNSCPYSKNDLISKLGNFYIAETTIQK